MIRRSRIPNQIRMGGRSHLEKRGVYRNKRDPVIAFVDRSLLSFAQILFFLPVQKLCSTASTAAQNATFLRFVRVHKDAVRTSCQSHASISLSLSSSCILQMRGRVIFTRHESSTPEPCRGFGRRSRPRFLLITVHLKHVRHIEPI